MNNNLDFKIEYDNDIKTISYDIKERRFKVLEDKYEIINKDYLLIDSIYKFIEVRRLRRLKQNKELDKVRINFKNKKFEIGFLNDENYLKKELLLVITYWLYSIIIEYENLKEG
jgi:uncharacterized protein YllA (UPF0747 family)